MHYCIYHFTLFSKTALEKRGLSNCPLFRLKLTTSKSLTSALKITHYRGHLSVISRNSKFHECYRSCARPRGSRADLDTSALDHVNHLRSEKLDCNQSGRRVAAILRRIFPHNFVSSSHIGLKKPQYSAAWWVLSRCDIELIIFRFLRDCFYGQIRPYLRPELTCL